jgi:hypothetical protein
VNRAERGGHTGGWRALFRALTEVERRDIREILAEDYAAEIRLARQLAEHANRYPDRRARLLEIAAREKEHARWLREAIERSGGRPPSRGRSGRESARAPAGGPPLPHGFGGAGRQSLRSTGGPWRGGVHSMSPCARSPSARRGSFSRWCRRPPASSTRSTSSAWPVSSSSRRWRGKIGPIPTRSSVPTPIRPW